MYMSWWGQQDFFFLLLCVNGAIFSFAVLVGLIKRGSRVRRSSGHDFILTRTIVNLESKKSTAIADKVYQLLHDSVLIWSFMEALCMGYYPTI